MCRISDSHNGIVNNAQDSVQFREWEAGERLPSRQDQLFLEARALHPQQFARWLLGQGRILFYLGENGYVKEFRLPSIIALLDRCATAERQP